MNGKNQQTREYLKKALFLQIVKWFLRYVLISGCKYTTDKNCLCYLGAYTFVSVYKGMQKFPASMPLGKLIEKMLTTVGEDIRENPQKADKIFEGHLLGGDKRWMTVVEALNSLDDYHRQVVVLYDIEMLNSWHIVELMQTPNNQLRLDLQAGENSVKQYLANSGIKFDDVCEEINILGRMVNMNVATTVAESVETWLEEKLQ